MLSTSRHMSLTASAGGILLVLQQQCNHQPQRPSGRSTRVFMSRVNQLNQSVFGEVVFSRYQPPLPYTGEQFGVHYLYHQTGRSFTTTGDQLDVQIRLDIWHFMRRLAKGCTSESHPLYGIFMSKLSQCIFEWDSDDYNLLMSAKRSEMRLAGLVNPSDSAIRHAITKEELSRHSFERIPSCVYVSLILAHNIKKSF